MSSTVKLTVLYFAALREQAGKEQEEIVLDALSMPPRCMPCWPNAMLSPCRKAVCVLRSTTTSARGTPRSPIRILWPLSPIAGG